MKFNNNEKSSEIWERTTNVFGQNNTYELSDILTNSIELISEIIEE